MRSRHEVRQLYEKEKKRYAKDAFILTIQECPAGDFLLSAKERLAKYGLEEYTVVEMFTGTIDASTAATSAENNTAGIALPVRGLGKFRAAIFLRDSFENCPNEIVHWVMKLGVLYHEVGHAFDYKLGVHTTLETGQSDLQKAEEYADNYAKIMLSKIDCRFDSTNGAMKNLWQCYNLFRHQGAYQPAPQAAPSQDNPPA